MNIKHLPDERFGPVGARLYGKLGDAGLWPFHDELATWIADHLARTAGEPPGRARPALDLLDLGSGTGALVARVAAKNPALTILGLDASPHMAAVAHRHLRRGRRPGNAGMDGPHGGASFPPADSQPILGIGDGEALPLRDACVRLAVSTLSFHHWEEPQASLVELYRVLVPGGALWILEPDPDFTLLAVRAGLRRWLSILPPVWLLRRAFRDHGFAAAEYESLVAPLVARTPFLSIRSVRPFLWLRWMTLRREPDHGT
ncbi:MAG: class I SAM-dependent methyltransferase [Acidobacteriota bacterium]